MKGTSGNVTVGGDTVIVGGEVDVGGSGGSGGGGDDVDVDFANKDSRITKNCLY